MNKQVIAEIKDNKELTAELIESSSVSQGLELIKSSDIDYDAFIDMISTDFNIDLMTLDDGSQLLMWNDGGVIDDVTVDEFHKIIEQYQNL